MAGNLTTGGLGAPGGLLVTGGMGAAEEAPHGAMRAVLAGSGSLTGTLVDGSSPSHPGGPPMFGYWARPILRPAKPIPGHMAAHLCGAGSLTGDLEGVLLLPPWADQLADLLLFDLI